MMTMTMMTTVSDICPPFTAVLSSESWFSIIVLEKTHLTCCKYQLREGFTLACDQNFDTRKDDENALNFLLLFFQSIRQVFFSYFVCCFFFMKQIKLPQLSRTCWFMEWEERKMCQSWTKLNKRCSQGSCCGYACNRAKARLCLKGRICRGKSKKRKEKRKRDSDRAWEGMVPIEESPWGCLKKIHGFLWSTKI